MNKAVFLDRDDTIILDKGYISAPEDIIFLPMAISILYRIQKDGFLLVMVSNQSGIGRGYFTEEQYYIVETRFKDMLEAEGIHFSKFYHCPHTPNSNCNCRKPKPFFAFKAANELNINLTESYMVGDKDSDIEFGMNFGAKGVFRNLTDFYCM